MLALLPLPVCGQYTLYTCGSSTKDYVVGAKLPASGIFLKAADGQWRHAGFNHPFIAAFDFDPRDPSVVYAAAGNGLLRISGGGERWRILTGSNVTELLNVALDRNDPGTIYFSHTAGIQVSHNRGATWQDAASGLRRKYTSALRVDSRRAGVLLAGGEQGIFRSQDGGKNWRLAGAAGIQVLHIEQSPHDPCYWIAATQGGGLFDSSDCGVSFESNGNLGVGRNLYDIAFDPASPNRIAVAGWGTGVAIYRRPRQILAGAQLRASHGQRLERGLRPRPTRPHLHQRSRRRDLCVRGQRPDLGEGRLAGSSIFRMKFVPETPRP